MPGWDSVVSILNYCSKGAEFDYGHNEDMFELSHARLRNTITITL